MTDDFSSMQIRNAVIDDAGPIAFVIAELGYPMWLCAHGRSLCQAALAMGGSC
jgi:hypothetical protein